MTKIQAEQAALNTLAHLAQTLAAAVADPKAEEQRATARKQIQQAQALDHHIRRKRV